MARLTDYPQPSVTVDVLIFSMRETRLQVALIKRGGEPFAGMWAIPGGFVHMDESLEEAARREVEEEAGVREVFLEQLYSFGEPNRDPRGRVITVAYYALVPADRLTLTASTDATEASWFPVAQLPGLAFDHAEILRLALERLRAKLQYSNVAYGLLPAQFRLSELQEVYEAILGEQLDKRNFRKRILGSGLLEATGEFASGAHRPAQLYRWTNRESLSFL